MGGLSPRNGVENGVGVVGQGGWLRAGNKGSVVPAPSLPPFSQRSPQRRPAWVISQETVSFRGLASVSRTVSEELLVPAQET